MRSSILIAALLAACTSGSTKDDDTDPEAVFDTFDTSAFLIDTDSVPGVGASLIITGPDDGAEVVGPELNITWEVNGCSINFPSQDPTACHLHRYIDGAGLSEDNSDGFGLYQTTPFDIRDVEPGEHTITVVLIPNDKPDGFDDNPHRVAIGDEITITVLAPTETGETGDTSEPDDTSVTLETGDTGDTSETGDTGDTADTSDTAPTGDTATLPTGDSADTDGTAAPAPTGDTGPIALP